MVEHDLAKVGVASSSLVSRSKCKTKKGTSGPFFCVWIFCHGRREYADAPGAGAMPCSAVSDGEIQGAFGHTRFNRWGGLNVACLKVQAGQADVKLFDQLVGLQGHR